MTWDCIDPVPGPDELHPEGPRSLGFRPQSSSHFLVIFHGETNALEAHSIMVKCIPLAGYGPLIHIDMIHIYICILYILYIYILYITCFLPDVTSGF